MAEPNLNTDAVEELGQGKSRNWYVSEIKEIAEPTRKLFEEYSGIPAGEVMPHIQKVVSMPIPIH
jgi:hypothetical protein